MWNKIHNFHQTRQGYLLFGLVEAVLAYIFISAAIDTASMWIYILAALLVIGSGVNLANAIFYGKTKRKLAGAETKRQQ